MEIIAIKNWASTCPVRFFYFSRFVSQDISNMVFIIEFVIYRSI